MNAVALPERQQTREWLRRRQQGIGSSDAAVIAGVSPYSDIRTLFAEKLGWAAPSVETAATSWGHRLEDTIAHAWAEETGHRIRRRRQLLRHPQIAWMLASLDRTVVGERAILEVKNRRFADDEWGASGTDEVPAHVRLQVLHAMAVSGTDVAYVAALFAGSDLRRYEVPRDDDLLADLVELESAFWHAVQDRELPPALSETVAPIAIRAGEIAADEDLALLAEHYRLLTEKADEIEKDLAQVKDDIRGRLADVAAAQGRGFRITYKPQSERHRVGWEQIAGAYHTRLLELGADPGELETVRDLYTRTEPGIRPLRITFKEEPVDDIPF